MAEQQPEATQEASKEEGPEFAIQRLYVKDLSLEAPNSPKIFLDEWQPELKLDLETKTERMDPDTHEVTLRVTVTVKIKDQVAFLVEVQQAGIFTLKGFPEDQERPMLGSWCPTVLYPYAREVVTDAVVKAGFPQLYLAPVNFDALLAEHDQQETADQGESDSGAVH